MRAQGLRAHLEAADELLDCQLITMHAEVHAAIRQRSAAQWVCRRAVAPGDVVERLGHRGDAGAAAETMSVPLGSGGQRRKRHRVSALAAQTGRAGRVGRLYGGVRDGKELQGGAAKGRGGSPPDPSPARAAARSGSRAWHAVSRWRYARPSRGRRRLGRSPATRRCLRL